MTKETATVTFEDKEGNKVVVKIDLDNEDMLTVNSKFTPELEADATTTPLYQALYGNFIDQFLEEGEVTDVIGE